MRWPWVSRAQLETAVIEHQDREGEADHARQVAERDAARADGQRDLLAEQLAATRADLAAERERYVALVAQVIELKKLDYGPVPVIPVPPQVPVIPIPASIAANIARTTDPETRERRAVEKRVRDLLAMNVPEREVASMVLDGEEIPVDA